MSSQVNTRMVSLNTIMQRHSFLTGLDEGSRGLPYNKRYDLWETNEQWSYERGRLLGVESKLRGVRPIVDRKVNPRLRHMYMEMQGKRAIL